MVRQPVTTMDFHPHAERRGSLDEEEFRARSQTLGSTGRVARPTKFWHRRARSEKRKPIIANGSAAVVKSSPRHGNGQVGNGGEVYDLESLQSDEMDKMIDTEYPSDGDLENIVPGYVETPNIMITATDLPKSDDEGKRFSSPPLDLEKDMELAPHSSRPSDSQPITGDQERRGLIENGVERVVNGDGEVEIIEYKEDVV